MLGFTAYAQKEIPFDNNLDDELVNYMCLMDYGDIVEYIDYIKESDPSVRNHELLQIRDLIDNQAIELKDITHDFGIYEFYFPYQTEEWIYVFVKYKDMITIIKDDFFDE